MSDCWLEPNGKAAEVQVIIPVYNAEKTLARCLDSLKAQTCRNWEAILIDDCSKDGSWQLMQAEAAKDSRLRIYRNEQNLGVAGTRNRGLSLLDAPYAMFLDSDDTVDARMLASMLKVARSADWDVVQCRFRYDFDNGRQVTPRGAFSKETALTGRQLVRIYRKMCVGINMNHVCMKLFKTSLIQGLTFDTAFRTAEDLVFCARVFERARRYLFVDEVFYHYYRASGSLTGGGLAWREKWRANKGAAREIKHSLRVLKVKDPVCYLLADLRIYIITLSKVLRSIRESVKRS